MALIIKKEVIAAVRAMQNSPLKDIDFRVSMSNRSKFQDKTWGGKANVYLGIKGTNLALAHICENRCSIIPREIMTCKGQIIDVVGQMLPCFWDKSGNEERFVDSSRIDAGYLSRVIMSIQKYGTLSTPLPDNIVVHHKGPLYLNTVESLMAVTEERHDDIHTEQSQKSHAEEKVINTPNELLDFLKEVQKKNKDLGKSKM